MQQSTLYVPALREGLSVYEAALAYAEAGWYVLPVKGKKPIIPNWKVNSTKEPTHQMFTRATGVALHMGRSGAVGIDIDAPLHWRHKITQEVPFQSTRPSQPDRGHYIFLQPTDRVIGNGGSGEWGEVRGLNGYLVVVPSWHPDEGLYQWRRVGEVPTLPDEIADLLPSASEQQNSETVKDFLRLDGRGNPKLLNYVAQRMQDAIEAGVGRHTAAYEHVCWGVREVRAGLYPAFECIDTLYKVFLQYIDPDAEASRYQQAEAEFENIVRHAVGNTVDEAQIIRARLVQPTGVRVDVR